MTRRTLRRQAATIFRAALRAAQEVAPVGTRIEIFSLDAIPPFNADHEQNPPECVTSFKARIRAADAVLFATPEYKGIQVK